MSLRSLFRRGTAICCVAVSGLLPLAAGAGPATLLTENGLLVGATGVEIDGETYSVSFEGGSCNSLFSNCSSFVFQTQAAAGAASEALLTQVLVGVFDDSPNLTRGCGRPDYCFVVTPYQQGEAAGVGAVVFLGNALNQSAASALEDATSFANLPASHVASREIVYAVWTLEADAAAVPEPGSLALLILAGGALALVQRRRRCGGLHGVAAPTAGRPVVMGLRKGLAAAALATLSGACQADLVTSCAASECTVVDEAHHVEWLFDWGLAPAGSWATQKAWAEGLDYAGHDDWVLPDSADFSALLDSVGGPAGLSAIFDRVGSIYWTATVYSDDYTYTFNAAAGGSGLAEPSRLFAAVAVRSLEATPVPEPQSWALVLAALGAAACARSRRSSR